LKDLLLGIDIGTTGTKSAVFTFSGKLLSSGQSDYGMYHEHPGWAEQNPEDWWDAVRAATRKSVSEVREGPERIAGIAVSSQAPTLLPLDRSGKVVRPGLPSSGWTGALRVKPKN
jgi:xylulokinase